MGDERVVVAERQIARVRLAVVALATLTYGFLLPHDPSTEALAGGLLAVAWAYSVFVVWKEPYRKYGLPQTSLALVGFDAVSTMVWLYATGGVDSPFFVLLYVVIIGMAFRFTPRETLAAAALYSSTYVGLAAWQGDLESHVAVLTIRVGYLFLAAAIGALLSQETSRQTRVRNEYVQVAEASRALGEELEQGRALEGIVGVGLHLLKADRGAIYLVEPDGSLRCAYSTGLSREYIAERIRHSRALPADALLSGGDHVHVPDARSDPRLASVRAAVEQEGFRTYLVVPLRIHDQTLGLLSLYRDPLEPFEAEELEVAKALAGQAAVVLQNARLVQELRLSEGRFRSLVESVEDIVFTADRDQHLMGVYGRWMEKEGLKASAVRGRTLASVLGADDPAIHDNAHRRALSGEHVVYEWTVHRPYGVRTFQTSLSPLREAAGTVSAVVGVGRDITDQKKTETQLKTTLSLLTATLESTTDGLVVVDRDGRITSFNQQFIDLWRIPSSVLASRDDEAARSFFLDQLKDSGAFFSTQRDLEDRPGVESFDLIDFKDGRVFERYSKPQRLGDAIVGRVWSFRDITERSRAERERQAAQERLQELDRLKELDRFKTQFINTAAHELGTPLTPITIQVHMLRTGQLGSLSDEQRRALDILGRNVDRLAQLVADVLEVARLQAGRLAVNRQSMDLNHAVQEAVDSFLEPARRAGIRLEAELAPELRVVADGKRLIQVLFNLIGNAIKFTPPGGRVLVATEAVDGNAVFRVRDTGIGLRSEDLAKLFQPFSQVHDPMQRTHAGTGLGLYISRGIVEQHGGRIWAESGGPNQGSLFAVSMPTETVRPPEAAAATVTSSY